MPLLEDNDIKKYAYLPVPTLEWKTVVHSWNEEKKKKGRGDRYQILEAADTGWVKGLRRAFRLGALRKVRPQDRLYVLLHGITFQSLGMAVPTKVGSARRGEMVNGRWQSVRESYKFYAPGELARHLAAEGLNRRHVQLDLFSCSAGLGDTKNKPFAQQLSRELFRLGYQELTVVAYEKDIEKKYGTPTARGDDERESGHTNKFAKGEHKRVKFVEKGSQYFVRLIHARKKFKRGQPV